MNSIIFRTTLFKFKLLSASILMFSLAFYSTCFRGDNPQHATPMVLGVADDVSGSVSKLTMEKLSMEHIEHLLSILAKIGGTMAFGLIDENSDQRLTRLDIRPVVGPLNKRARINQQNQQTTIKFNEEVNRMICTPGNAKYTDVNGALSRFALFFKEPTYQHHDKVLIFYSDGIHTSRRNKYLKVQWPENVKVLAVGMKPHVARQLFGGSAMVFENIDAAIKYMEQQYNQTERN